MSKVNKKDIMHRKLVSIMMNKNKYTSGSWMHMTQEEVLALRHLPFKLRQLIVKFKQENRDFDLDAIAQELKEVGIESTITQVEDVLEKEQLPPEVYSYDPSAEISDIMKDFVEPETEVYYTEAELRSFFTEADVGTSLKEVIANVTPRIIDANRVQVEVLNNIAKEYLKRNRKGSK